MEFNATFLILIISFIIFVLLMNKILYKPLENIVQERENFIKDNYSNAQKADSKSDSLLKQKAEILAEAKLNAKSSMNKALEEANRASIEMLKNAKDEYTQNTEAKKQQLYSEKSDIESKMNENTEIIAQLVSDKLLQKHFPIRRNK